MRAPQAKSEEKFAGLPFTLVSGWLAFSRLSGPPRLRRAVVSYIFAEIAWQGFLMVRFLNARNPLYLCLPIVRLSY